jgi:tRNA pseudouridine55 synthase
VSVYGIDVLSFAWPNLDVEVRCGKGTYIRSLARDLGATLGCGGLVTTLRRLRIGPFSTEQAIAPDAELSTIRASLRPMSDAVAELPRVDVAAGEAERLRHGQSVDLSAPAGQVAVFSENALIGVAQSDGRILRPMKTLPNTGEGV